MNTPTMAPAYKVLYDYTMHLINDDIQARRIVDFALLEGITVAIKDRDAEKARELIIATIHEKCRAWKGEQK